MMRRYLAALGAGAVFASLAASAAAAEPGTVALPRSVAPTTDAIVGAYHAPRTSVEIVLAPRNAQQLDAMAASVSDPHSPSYRRWLAKGQFAADFAPTAAQVAAVSGFLRASGLAVAPSGSPFVVRAAGSSDAVAAAFRTSLATFRNPRGQSYFANTAPVRIPATIAPAVIGVLGLSNAVRVRPQYVRPQGRPAAATVSTSPPACDAPYPTAAQLFAAVNFGTPFAFGYGDGPGCSGLTPNQENAVYGAPHVGRRGQGAGTTLAVFELSAYQASDIVTWAHQFYGAAYAPPLVDVNVDGGPLAPNCPAGDTCPPEINGYAGDIEVDADIETQLAVAPAASRLIVYNAPNDFTGQTELDEYRTIAADDVADVVSSSWSVCEQDVTAAYVQSENLVFEQMALQGQSVFGAAGDTGAFGCLRSDGTAGLAVPDPPAQPYVTSVGGTSLESFDPDANQHPAYPKQGVETVWNVDQLCNTSANEGGQNGLFWCAVTGAGGGGNSMYWARPAYQAAIGLFDRYGTTGNGSTQCSLAATGQPCRAVPDVSLDADEYTPYAEYCTGNASTPNSACGTFSSAQPVPGWFGIGGTSLSSPFWSAIIADRDGYEGLRSGNVNALLYSLALLGANADFHDITGIGQATDTNGFFPATPGYDHATGIGTARMSALITGAPGLSGSPGLPGLPGFPSF